MNRRGARRWLAPVIVMTCVVGAVGCAQQGQSLVDDGIDICNGTASDGCACEPGRRVACYPQAPLTDESGEPYCVEGYRECGVDGTWSDCVFPEDAERYAIVGDPELCGGCDPACWRVHDCPTGRDLDETNASNVRFDLDANGIVLGGSIVNTRYAYVANDPASTVSKIDLANGDEVGRYLVGLQENGSYNRPSRTALDSRGNTYVASRAFSRYGSVTKIAGDESFCYDRNMNGVIDTSTGGADVRPWNQDECVLWTVGVGGYNGVPRALAVDADDQIWVGLFNLRRFDVLDPADGHRINTVAVSGYPYGAAIGGDGRLWYPNSCCGNQFIQSVDTTTFTAGPIISRPTRIRPDVSTAMP